MMGFAITREERTIARQDARKRADVALPILRSAQRSAYCRDDPVLRRLVEISVHRQADHFVGKPFTHWKSALRHRKTLICLLDVNRLCIIDRRRNALLP